MPTPLRYTRANVITVQELERLSTLKSQYRELKEQLDLLEASVREVECAVLAKLNAGATVPSGFEVTVKRTERRYPAWKEFFIKHVKNGKQVADRILARTKPTVSRTVLVKAVMAGRRAA